MITIRDIHRKVNLPTLLILPAFANLLAPKGVMLKNKSTIPLIVWLFESGLQKCLLELNSKEITPTGKHIVFVFNQDVLKNHDKLRSTYHSLLERLIDNKWFVDNWTNEDTIYIRFKIPKLFIKDINHIIDSNYTKVSEKFVNQSKTRVSKVPRWSANMGTYIAKNNFAAAVFKQHASLKQLTEVGLNVRMPDGVDLVRKFDFELDCFDY